MAILILSLIVGAVVFVISFVGSLFATGMTFPMRLQFALLAAGMAIVAALLLSWRDFAQYRRTRTAVRDKLRAREDVSEPDFLAQFPGFDAGLMNEVRRFTACFFDVPVEKIHPGDNLMDDLQANVFEPGFHLFVLHSILAERKIELREKHWICFEGKCLKRMSAFAFEIDRILAELRGLGKVGRRCHRISIANLRGCAMGALSLA